jgi:hypothetical protein
MSDKERVDVFRGKRWRDAFHAHLDAGTATTAVLMAGLHYQIKSIDKGLDAGDPARERAAIIIRELCDRNKIILPQL